MQGLDKSTQVPLVLGGNTHVSRLCVLAIYNLRAAALMGHSHALTTVSSQWHVAGEFKAL